MKTCYKLQNEGTHTSLAFPTVVASLLTKSIH